MPHHILRHQLTSFSFDRFHLPREADLGLNLRVRIRR